MKQLKQSLRIISSRRTKSLCVRLGMAFMITAAIVACGQQPPSGVASSSDMSNNGGASFPAPVLGVTVDASMHVLDVEAGSPAARAGIQRGDILETLENIGLTATDGKAQVKQLIRNAKNGQKLRLTLQRAGKKATLEITLTPRPIHPAQPTPTPVTVPNDYF